MTRTAKLIGSAALTLAVVGGAAACGQPILEAPTTREVVPVNSSDSRDIIANNAFFYYTDLEAAWGFYTGTLGIETVADYGFAKILRLASTSYLTLVDADSGTDFSDAPKTVALALVTDELNQWWDYLAGEGVSIRGSGYEPRAGSPHDGFVVIDPEGYYLEFERFNIHPENQRLSPILAGLEPLYPPPGMSTRRPAHLGIKATILWLYARDVHAMSDFYRDTMGFGLVVDQGWAMIHHSSPSGFVGPVDGGRGMHPWTEDKAVMVSLLTTDIDGWFAHLADARGFTLRDDEVGVEDRAGARVFVGKDPDGYLLEFDEFFAAEGNESLLETLAAKR